MLGPTTAIPCAAAAKVLAKTYRAILDTHMGLPPCLLFS
jgi:hypothetical protein